MMEEAYYMSQIDNRLYYVKDAHIVAKPNLYIVQHIFRDTRVEEIRKLIKLHEISSIKELKMDEKLYFVSQFDDMVHNLEDLEYKKISDSEAYIGHNEHDDGFRVDEEVSLWTLEEIVEFFGHLNVSKKGKENE